MPRKYTSSKIPRVCQQCGTTTWRYPSEVARRVGIYCSVACSTAARAATSAQISVRVTCTCQFCGKSFLEYPSRIAEGRGRYCSKPCMYAGKPKTDAKSKVAVICAGCGTAFLAWPSRIRQGKARYCSKACAYANHTHPPRKPNFRACEQCGEQFHRPPSMDGPGQGKYCSRACYAEAQRRGQYVDALGYVRLWVDGENRHEHRYVWEQAHGPIPRGFVVHHINEDKTDNRLGNLQLMSRAEHARHHRR